MKRLIYLFAAAILAGCSRGPTKQDLESVRASEREMQGRIAALQERMDRMDAMDRTNGFMAMRPEIADLDDALARLRQAERIGAVTTNDAKFYRDVLTGKIPMYVGKDGQLTTNRFGP